MNNNALNFWKFYNKEYPFNVMVIGQTECGEDYYVHRENSHIMAIEYMISGTETLHINTKSYTVPKNSAILLTKGSRHEYYCSENTCTKKVWMVFDGVLAENLIKMYLPDNVYCFENCNLIPLFDEINRIQEKYSNNYEVLINEIAIVLHRIMIRIRDSFEHNEITLADQIQKYLDANIEKKVTLAELAAVFSYSKNQIIRIFKGTYGITPYRYFIERKIDIAKLYLSNTKNPISEISQILAFSDQNYFSSEFKRITSLSPSEYRKKVQ